jgi:GAF domain-containing protein
MDLEGELQRLRGAALQALVDRLLLAFEVGRCTLRLDGPPEPFAVAYEARRPGVRSLIDDREVSLSGQPVVETILVERRQVVQHDSRAAHDDPAFQRMLDSYGDMGAQIVTPVVVDGTVRGIISLHHLGAPRRWSVPETTLAGRAAAIVAGVLNDPADGPR